MACWLTDDLVICQRFSPTAVAIVNPFTGEVLSVHPRACNQLTAGVGRAAAADGVGVFGTITFDGYALGLTEQDGRGATGPEGTLAIVRHGGVGFELHAPDGSVTVGPAVIARGLNVLGATSALWHDDAGQLHGLNCVLPVHLSTVASPVVVATAGVPWLVSFCSSIGLVAHPWDSLIGVQLTGAGENAFYPDAKVVNGKLIIVWANGPGELPHDLRRVEDAFALPRQNLGETAPSDPLTPIHKPMWLGFFTGQPGAAGGWDTTDDPIGPPPPGNGFLDVPTFKFYSDATGQPIGSYITGGSVEEIEAAAARCADIPVCYWDARRWPRTPNLPDGLWLCVQAYRNTTEPIANFEADIRNILHQHVAERPNLQHAIVPQCYTSNTSMTLDLTSIVPVVSRLAASLPLHAIIPFSGSGRKTGLQDHPEVRPLWEELYRTITRAPGEGTTPGGRMDWGTIHQYGIDRWKELDVQQKSQELVDRGLECRDFQKDCFVKIASELYHEKHIPLELFWKSGIPEYGNAQDVKEKLRFIGEDILVDRPTSEYKDVVVSMGIPSASWNATGGGSPVQGSDLNRCSRPPNLEGVGPVDPVEPVEPGTVAVFISRYDETFHRGGAGSEDGMEIVFEVASERPIREVEVFLDDGSPRFSFQFTGELDARYIRGLRWKPVINGSWYPVVRGKNDAGVWGEARGATPVIVTSIS